MKYFSVETVVNAYKGFQDSMTNRSWGYLALLKGCKNYVCPSVPNVVDLDVVSNFLEDIFNLSQTKRNYDSGRFLYVVFSNKWDHYFNDQGSYSPNIYDVIVWAYRRKSFHDDISNEDIISMFAKEFNIPSNIISNSFNLQTKHLRFSNSLYSDSDLKTRLSSIGVDVSKDNIDAKKGGVVAAPGEISRGPFVQTLYAGLEITDYVLILQSDYLSLYGTSEGLSENNCDVAHGDLPLQQIFYGAPGTGKSHEIKEQTKGQSVIRTTFHPDSDYSTFVGAYKPTTTEETLMTVIGTKAVPVENADGSKRTESKIVYEFVEQAFLKAYIKAWKMFAEDENNPKRQYLVIEEINRGNCAQIFGDLFQLLDRDDNGFSEYPIEADQDMKKHLAKAFKDMAFLEAPAIGGMDEEETARAIRSGEKLILPKNLYIWATMNTSDQSLFPIDSAFKRRWDWEYVPIYDGGKGWMIEADGKRYDWWKFVDSMNNKIGATTYSEDKKLGYFFCKAKDGVVNAETFVSKVIFYIWNDVFKDFAEEAGNLFKDVDGSMLSFNKFYTISTEGKKKVVESKISIFMQNLGVEPITISDSGNEEVVGDVEEEQLNDMDGNKRKETLISISIPNHPIIKSSESTQFDAFIKALRIIGLERIKAVASSLKYKRLGNCPVISMQRDEVIENNNKGYSYYQEGGLFIIKGCKYYTYIRILEDLNSMLNIGLTM